MNEDQIGSLQLQPLREAFASGELDPERTLAAVYARIEAVGARGIFIEQVPLESARAALAQQVMRRDAGIALPLYGVPFAVKDGFDVSGLATTAACPAFSYRPEKTAPAIERLIAAGAILVGKTNMDQFATGLVGVRTPYGVRGSALNESYVPGGSSSGSALAVAHGLVSFALGTDTAGSGRVPAAFNNIVGVKPTRGLVSTRGVVPACRSLDCPSVFASSVSDARQVLSIMAGHDALDPLSRVAPAHSLSGSQRRAFRFALPRALDFFGNAEYERLFARAAELLTRLGGFAVEVDVEPFVAAGALLYGGPWVAERYAAVGDFIERHQEATHPVVRDIILAGKAPLAHELFRATYTLAEYRRAAERVFEGADCLLLPTAGTHYMLEEVAREPVRLNANLGRYTNFVNLLDLAAVAVPADFTANGLPFGITLMGPAFSDGHLAAIAERFQHASGLPLGAAGEVLAAPPTAPPSPAPEAAIVELAVAGAHLSGMPLNHELSSRGATLVRTCRTSRDYQLYALAGTVPPKPGLIHRPGFSGPGIEVEIWALTAEAFGSFVARVPAPMTIGTLTLDDGSTVKGFCCEPHALEGSPDITHFGGFRAYVAAQAGR